MSTNEQSPKDNIETTEQTPETGENPTANTESAIDAKQTETGETSNAPAEQSAPNTPNTPTAPANPQAEADAWTAAFSNAENNSETDGVSGIGNVNAANDMPAENESLANSPAVPEAPVPEAPAEYVNGAPANGTYAADAANSPSTNAQEQLTEMETTVVRRQSLLGPGGGNAPQAQPHWQPRPDGADDSGQALPGAPGAPNMNGEPGMPAAPGAYPNQGYVLAGASVKPGPISRTGAHLLSLLVAVIGVPLAWIFLAHSGGMLGGIENSTWATGRYSIEGLIFLILGLALVVTVGVFTRSSSLGMFVTGSLVTAGGFIPIFIPGMTKAALTPSLEYLADSTLVPLQNLGYYFARDLSTGVFAAIGVALIMIGVVAHSARRKGRRDAAAAQALQNSAAPVEN